MAISLGVKRGIKRYPNALAIPVSGRNRVLLAMGGAKVAVGGFAWTYPAFAAGVMPLLVSDLPAAFKWRALHC